MTTRGLPRQASSGRINCACQAPPDGACRSGQSRRVSWEACSCNSQCSLSHIRLASVRYSDTVRCWVACVTGSPAPREFENVLCETPRRAFCLDMCLRADGYDRWWSCLISLAFVKGCVVFASSFCPSLDALDKAWRWRLDFALSLIFSQASDLRGLREHKNHHHLTRCSTMSQLDAPGLPHYFVTCLTSVQVHRHRGSCDTPCSGPVDDPV